MPIRSYAIEFLKNLTPQDFPLSACWSAIRSTNTRHIYPDFSHNEGEWYLNMNLLYQKDYPLYHSLYFVCTIY